ncbi:hypothetical protein [Streptomyces roseifaciens]|uniref:hypothetical protein n=1 Tax=Streptomyces roseifaciens TaxID=1488406 RepID=UPI0007182D89|nr:hypothetical protein [Streptomyces roseifaciens]
MFFGDVVVDPSWTFELTEALRDRWYEKEEVDLTFPATLDQLRSWLDDSRDFERRHRFYWQAAMNDFDDGVNRLGPEYRQGLTVQVDTFRSAMEGLPAAGAEEQVAQASQLLLSLAREACSDGQLICAWRDVVSAVRDGQDYEVIRMRTGLLRALLKRSQRGSAEVMRSITGVLLDRQIDVRVAQLSLGDVADLSTLSRQDAEASAGLSEEARLDLSVRLLTVPPRRAHHVVWHAFAKARIAGMVQTFGSITLYDRDWFHGNATEDGPHRDQLPHEVTEAESFFPTDWLPEGPHVVLVRVDLGVVAAADAPAVSRLQARSMVLAATFPEDFRGWEMYVGYIHAVDGICTSNEAFRLAEEDFATPHLQMDATAERLNRMAPRVAPHLPGANSDLSDVIDAVGWWKASSAQPSLPAVVLDVRILELLASRVSGQEWYVYLDNFHKNAWIQHQIAHALMRVAWHARDDLRHFTPDVGQAAEALRREMVQYEGMGFHTDIHKVISRLPDLVLVYPTHSKQRRRAESLARRVAGGEGMHAWYEEFNDRWSRALNRLRSVRNSLAHGGPVTPGAAASVAPLAHFLAGTGLMDSLSALLEGESQATAHAKRRDNADTWAARWLSGIPASETFDAWPAA